MKSTRWDNIWNEIEYRQDSIVMARQAELKSPWGNLSLSPGIAVMNDPLALEWQRLEKIKHHVGCHFCAQRDREHNMKTARCAMSVMRGV